MHFWPRGCRLQAQTISRRAQCELPKNDAHAKRAQGTKTVAVGLLFHYHCVSCSRVQLRKCSNSSQSIPHAGGTPLWLGLTSSQRFSPVGPGLAMGLFRLELPASRPPFYGTFVPQRPTASHSVSQRFRFWLETRNRARKANMPLGGSGISACAAMRLVAGPGFEPGTFRL